MTMISDWLQAEEPDRSEAPGFYIPGATHWGQHPHMVVPADAPVLFCHDTELPPEIVVTASDEQEAVSLLEWSDDL